MASITRRFRYSNGNGGTLYTTSFNIGTNADANAHVFTACVYADDTNRNRSTVAATGSTTLAANDTAPVVTGLSLTPAALPYNGGTLTIFATVTSALGLRNVQANIFRDGINWSTITLQTPGVGNSYSGTSSIWTNDDLYTHVYTAAVYATDITGNVTAVGVPGSCSQATDSGIPSPMLPAPAITSFSPSSGMVGTTVTISGSNFIGASSVAFNGTAAAFTIGSASSITATVGVGSTTGFITVTTPGGTGSSASAFVVKPAWTVTPTAGANGSISPNTAQTVLAGSSLTFTATPNTGYTVNTWSLDGTVVQTGGTPIR